MRQHVDKCLATLSPEGPRASLMVKVLGCSKNSKHVPSLGLGSHAFIHPCIFKLLMTLVREDLLCRCGQRLLGCGAIRAKGPPWCCQPHGLPLAAFGCENAIVR